jgi:hypothetical protein
MKIAKRISGILACLGLATSAFSGCGILGEKESASRTLSQDNDACLDELGPLMEQFLDGSVNEAKWIATWSCVDDTVDLFKKFVQGSNAASYTPEDLRFLMQKFLFAKNPVTPTFVQGFLNVKASLLGGNAQVLTKDELENYRGLIRFIRDETTALIPHFRNRKQNPTPENLRAFANAIEAFGGRFADFLNTSKNAKLTLDQSVSFMRELASIGLKVEPARIEEWTRFIQELKLLLVAGAEDGIAGADWTKILKFGFKAGGALIAYVDAQGDDPLFQSEMVDRIHTVLKGSLADHGGNLPFSRLERMINHTPRELLPRLGDDFIIGAKALLNPRTKKVDNTTQTFRPALAKILMSKIDTGIDAQAIDRVAAIFHRGMRGNWHLKKILTDPTQELYAEEFASRAKVYAATRPASEQEEIQRLVTIAQRYRGFFPATSKEILFERQDKHTLNNLKHMNWFENAAGSLLEAYATASDSYGKAAFLSDLTVLVDDVQPILYPFGMFHPLKPGIDAKRFREANLFMPTGNGDDKLNLPETATYIAYMFSASFQSSRLMDLTLKGSNPCPTKGWNVPLKQQLYDIQCFRTRWLANFQEIFSSMPRMQDEYRNMTQPQRDEYYRTLEQASKMTGYDDTPITEYDAATYAGIPHFAEAVMGKFDRNGDATLDRNETLDHVFPVFKRELAVISKIKIDFVNKAVLLYLMQYGKKPEIVDLLKWAIGFEFLKKFNARRIRVYQIFAALSPAAKADPVSDTPPTGLSNSTPLGFMANSLVKGLLPIGESTRTIAGALANANGDDFDLSSVDPVQFEGYGKDGPIIDPASPYQEALEVLPQDL